jgi:HEPN domain-containing protein
MPPEASGEEERWYGQAEHDLDDARYLRDGGRFSSSCFLAQQAAEKALKGALIKLGSERPMGHTVADLVDRLAHLSDDESWAENRGRFVALDVFSIPTRYPDALPIGLPADAFGQEEADRAISTAEEILRLVAEAIE